MAVDDLTFEVGRGEVVGFLGPNGAGTTTTMRLLAAFEIPASRADLLARPPEGLEPHGEESEAESDPS